MKDFPELKNNLLALSNNLTKRAKEKEKEKEGKGKKFNNLNQVSLKHVHKGYNHT